MFNNRREILAMKRFIAVLSSLLVLPAFAEVMPTYYYEETMEYADENEAAAANETSKTPDFRYSS